MHYLTVEDAIVLMDRMGLHARDLGLLATAVGRPQTSVFGEDVYPSLELKIASMMESLNRNHPLIDGNKRLSWMCSVAFARLNGFDLRGTQDDIFDIVMRVAEGRVELPELADWMRTHLHPRSKSLV